MLTSKPNFFVSGCDEEDMGQLAQILHEPMRSFVPRWSKKGASLQFSPRTHTGLVILGDNKFWATSSRYQRDREWLATALRSGTPILGICYGAQLLAAFLEGRTGGRQLAKRQTTEHQGTLLELALDAEGIADPVIGHLSKGLRVPQYHLDACQPPPGATVLAWSTGHTYRHCEAFRVGAPEAAIYGLQFHPEPTLQMLAAEPQDERWFEVIPPHQKLKRAVDAGKLALLAWIDLAIARTHSRRQSR